jgi:beta-lactamase class A
LDTGSALVERFSKVAFLMAALAAPALHAADDGWQEKLQEGILSLNRGIQGEVGLYVKDLSSGEEYSFRGEEDWYLASGVKVPVAVELLKQVEGGKRSLEETVAFQADDLIDGSPILSGVKPGSWLSLRYLLEQMIIYSDNTATDLIIREIGLAAVNRGTSGISPGFHPITTLSDVRRITYSGIYPKALELKNADILRLKSVREKKRVRALASILQEKEEDAREKSVGSAFSAYYAKKLNSAPLRAYGLLLEKVAEGKVLEPASRDLLIGIMERTATGVHRIRAAFRPGIVWAHKTGTQHGRICDFGYAWPKSERGRKVVIAACARDFPSVKKAERALRSVGEAIRRSGIFPAR